MKLLIADDQAEFRAFLRALLVDVSTDIEECNDGEAALALYREKQPAWVLLDLRMKPAGGLWALRAIKNWDQAARVVIVTSFDDDHLRREALACGALGYVVKDDLRPLKALLSGAAD